VTPERFRALVAMYEISLGGLPGSLREVAERIGRSYRCAHDHARRLAADGYVELAPCKSRAYRVVAVPIFAGDPARVVGFTRPCHVELVLPSGHEGDDPSG
jgi:hypothetical protein